MLSRRDITPEMEALFHVALGIAERPDELRLLMLEYRNCYNNGALNERLIRRVLDLVQNSFPHAFTCRYEGVPRITPHTFPVLREAMKQWAELQPKYHWHGGQKLKIRELVRSVFPNASSFNIID